MPMSCIAEAGHNYPLLLRAPGEPLRLSAGGRALPLHEAAARESSEPYEWGNLGDTRRQIPGLQDKAADAYRRTVELAEKALSARPDNPAEVLSSLALYYAHLGLKQKALAAIARARLLAPAFLPGIQRAILACEAVGERSPALAALREFFERLGSIEDIEREPDLTALRCDRPFTVSFDWDAPFMVRPIGTRRAPLRFLNGAPLRPNHAHPYVISALDKGKVISGIGIVIVKPPRP